MVITHKTRLREMERIQPIASLAGVDILEACKPFAVPLKIRGLQPMPFYNVSMKNLAWFWDIEKPADMLTAFCEVFFYPAMPEWRKRYKKDSERWAQRWMLDTPLIDFYRFSYEMTEQVKGAAEQFAKIQVHLSEDERAAGYGQPDKDSVRKMIDAFARRQGISSLEDAADYPWTHYLFVFKTDTDEQNRQRKYNEIIAKKQKKK